MLTVHQASKRQYASSGLQGKPELHTGVIEKDAMLEYVLNL